MNNTKAILLCGKLCCGKSLYTEALRKERGAMVLSCDELMLRLFPAQLGDWHEMIAGKAQMYLLHRAAELLELSVPVILDWGFWSAEKRRNVDAFFRERGFETEWHYIHVDDETWARLVQKRNNAGPDNAYFVDENLLQKCTALFEEPAREEIDIWYENEWQPR